MFISEVILSSLIYRSKKNGMIIYLIGLIMVLKKAFVFCNIMRQELRRGKIKMRVGK